MPDTKELAPDNAGVIIFPPLLYLIAIILGLMIGYIFPYHLLANNISILIGTLLFITGFTIISMAARKMNNNKTTINPSGTTTIIVKDGIYKFTRNPMYLSFTLIFIAILIMANAWWGMLMLIPLFLLVQKGIIEREERYLAKKFGGEYLNYKSKVRRWF